MYDDPRHLKVHEIKVRFDEDSYQAIRALARLLGLQPSVLCRELLLDRLDLVQEENHEMPAARRR